MFFSTSQGSSSSNVPSTIVRTWVGELNEESFVGDQKAVIRTSNLCPAVLEKRIVGAMVSGGWLICCDQVRGLETTNIPRPGIESVRSCNWSDADTLSTEARD